MCMWEQRCNIPGLPGCLAASPLLGCENTGSRCFNCSNAIMTNLEPITRDAATGKFILSPRATAGHLMTTKTGAPIGWLIDVQVGGAAELELGDLIVAINGKVPTWEWFEQLHSLDGKPYTFDLEVMRAGHSAPLSVLLSRA